MRDGTPLSRGASNGRLEVITFLVKEGCTDVESKDRDAKMALDLARRVVLEPKVLEDSASSISRKFCYTHISIKACTIRDIRSA